MTFPKFHRKSLRTTIIGLAQAANGLAAAIEAIAHDYTNAVDPDLFGRFLIINAILQALKGWVSQDRKESEDASTTSERSH